MADGEDNQQAAKFRLVLPHNPQETDLLHVTFNYGDIVIQLRWHDAEREEVVRLAAGIAGLLDHCHLEYEVHKNAGQIDGDIDQLFPKGEGE